MAPRKTARHRSNNGTMRPYKDGERWIAPRRVTLPNGKEALIRGTGRTRTEADARLAANIGKRLQSTSPVAGDDPALGTVEGWARHWLDNIKRHDLRDSTYEGYRNAIDQWIAPRIGDLLLHLLTVEDLELLHAAMKEQGRGRSSWAQVRTVLNQSLEVAVDRGHISVNPARRAPKPGRPTRSLEHLSLEESRKVVKAANTLTERARALLALTLGLRPGECLALRWTDLELDGPQPTVSIARTIARRSGRGLVEGATKTEKSRRTLHLPSHLVQTLKDLRIEQEANAGHMSQTWDRDWHVLSTGTGAPFDASNDRKRWYRLLARAEVRKVRPHGARHTAASLMIGGGIDIHVVGNALGHSSISTTADIYGHVPGRSVAAAIALVADQLAG